MRTRIIKIDPKNVGAVSLRRMAGMLKREGVIVYPTDTFYGLGADSFSGNAVRRIYSLKKREFSKPLSVLASGLDMVEASTAHRPPIYADLADKFWPGPLTLILEAGAQISQSVLGSGRTLGIRWPESPWITDLLEECGFPVTATSANLSGQSEISRPEDAIKIFNHRVDCIVDGGPTPGGKPSTIVDLTRGKPVILREGAIPVSELRPFL
jgi:L-threonylcarbamoyladenylate synthase